MSDVYMTVVTIVRIATQWTYRGGGMTKQECAIVMAYTGVSMLQGKDFQIFTKYCEDLLGHPILTHEFPELFDEISRASRRDFYDLCANAE